MSKGKATSASLRGSPSCSLSQPEASGESQIAPFPTSAAITRLDRLVIRAEGECDCCHRRREVRHYCGGNYCQPCIRWNEQTV